MQVVLELVERLPLRVRTCKTRYVADIKPRLWASLYDCGVNLHVLTIEWRVSGVNLRFFSERQGQLRSPGGLRWIENRDSEGTAGANAAAVTERQAKPVLCQQTAREDVSCTVWMLAAPY